MEQGHIPVTREIIKLRLHVYAFHFFYDDKVLAGKALVSVEVNWMQLPPSSISFQVISQLASQPFFRPSPDTQLM